MKGFVILCLCSGLFFSCKKEKKADETNAPDQPAKAGKVVLQVSTFDSLGTLENDFSGVKASLSGTAFNAITPASGRVVFNAVPYGTYLPVLLRDYYDGVPTSFKLESDSIVISLPCAKQSPYRVVTLNGDATDKNLLTISFDLSQPLIGGKPARVAILSSASGTITNANYETADTITVLSQNVSNLNIAQLPNLSRTMESVRNNFPFKICVTTVSYGMLQSNITNRQNLLGDNLYYPNNLTFTKTWQ